MRRHGISIIVVMTTLLVSACMTVIPTELPPEGTTATTSAEGRTTVRRPDGSVVRVTESNWRSRVSVTNTPPRYRRDGPARGQRVLACTRVSDVWHFLDTGITREGQCQFRTATNARPRSSYRAQNGRCYNIMQFMVGGWWYYTAVPARSCSQSYRR